MKCKKCKKKMIYNTIDEKYYCKDCDKKFFEALCNALGLVAVPGAVGTGGVILSSLAAVILSKIKIK